MKRRRPQKHYRTIKTKKGRKRILINKNIKKPKVTTKGTIKAKDRKLFNFMSNSTLFNHEFGGAIDFDKKGNLEQINVKSGNIYDIDLPPDYEVQYHTHPTEYGQDPPSPEDIVALLSNKKQQAEIIFRDGSAFNVIKTPLSKTLSKLPATQLKKKLDKAFFSSQGRNWEQKYKKQLEDMGFIVFIDRMKNKDLRIPVVLKEPKRKR